MESHTSSSSQESTPLVSNGYAGQETALLVAAKAQLNVDAIIQATKCVVHASMFGFWVELLNRIPCNIQAASKMEADSASFDAQIRDEIAQLPNDVKRSPDFGPKLSQILAELTSIAEYNAHASACRKNTELWLQIFQNSFHDQKSLDDQNSLDDQKSSDAQNSLDDQKPSDGQNPSDDENSLHDPSRGMPINDDLMVHISFQIGGMKVYADRAQGAMNALLCTLEQQWSIKVKIGDVETTEQHAQPLPQIFLSITDS